jgi:hypothetical protein
MAYKKGKGKMARFKKLEPAVTTMTFTVNVQHATTQDLFIDLSQCASLLNRRFYRQGINWAVSGIKFLSQPGTLGNPLNGSITVEKLPETWVMSNAWEKGFRTWQKMNDEALAETESIRPRFLDYKIYADSAHHALGFVGNLLPINSLGTVLPGEWESSKMVIPKTDGTDDVFSREIIAVGASYPGASPVTTLNALSLIEGYAASRGLPNVLDPNAPADAADVNSNAPENWMAATFNEGTDQDDAVLTDMISENNIAPYPFENDGVSVDTMYPNGANQITGLQIHDFELVTGTTIGGTTRIKGGMFPCGLIGLRLQNNNTTPQEGSLTHTFTIDLVPGSHRGYLCEPMTDM